MQVSAVLRCTTTGYMFWCPGCDGPHHVVTKGPGAWGFSGDVDQPTFTPSIRVFRPANDKHPEETLCHSYVTLGNIQFLSDCKHGLAGKNVRIPPLPSEDEFDFGE